MADIDIKIRRAVESDYQAVNSLQHLSYSFYHQHIPHAFHPTPATVLRKGDFLNILGDKNGLMIVAETDGKVIGQLYAFVDDYEGDDVGKSYHRVEIGEISVSPEYQGCGIGTKLIQEAEKWAKEKKIVDLSVLTHDFNNKAISFYKANGYKPYSVKMEKKINRE